jgi:hypothetical protein
MLLSYSRYDYIKALVLIGLSADKARMIYFDHKYLSIFKKPYFRVPGYYIIETLCTPSFAASSENDDLDA